MQGKVMVAAKPVSPLGAVAPSGVLCAGWRQLRQVGLGSLRRREVAGH
jgi:hypothetical protein